MARVYWIARVPVADARARLADAVERWKAAADAGDLRIPEGAGDVHAQPGVTASLTVQPADLERVLFELARIDEILLKAGIEHPRGAGGVRDLAAFAEEAQTRDEPS